jgi:hypothetical protein
MPTKDYYQMLGLSQQADEKEIRRRFRELARKYHPDLNGKQHTARFHEINEAYQVLSDHRKRACYDMELRESNRLAAEHNAASGYGAYNGNGYARPQRPAPNPGERYASHSRPAQAEPMTGRVHTSGATSSEAIAGLALLVGMVMCAMLSYGFIQILNALAGDPPTTTTQPVDNVRDATRRAEQDDRATAIAKPTTTPVAVFNRDAFTLQSALVADSDLDAILNSTRPLLSNYCILDLTADSRPCSGREARRISTITGNTRDGRVSLQLDMDRQNGNDTAMRRAVFVVDFGSRPTGVSLNISDSRQGDADGRQSYAGDPAFNAEIVIRDGNLYIYGYTNACTESASTLLYSENDFVSAGSRVIFEISDQRVRWINETEGQELLSRCLFQLGGQTLSGGQPDYTIYAGFNRAVRTGTSKTGTGVERVEMYLLTEND